MIDLECVGGGEVLQRRTASANSRLPVRCSQGPSSARCRPQGRHRPGVMGSPGIDRPQSAAWPHSRHHPRSTRQGGPRSRSARSTIASTRSAPMILCRAAAGTDDLGGSEGYAGVIHSDGSACGWKMARSAARRRGSGAAHRGPPRGSVRTLLSLHLKRLQHSPAARRTPASRDSNGVVTLGRAA